MRTPQSPTINFDQIINSDEWTLLDSNEKTLESIREYSDSDDEWYTIAEVGEDHDYLLIDRIHREEVHDPATRSISTMSGHTVVIIPEIKIYLFTPRPPLPTETGSKIYNVTVQDISVDGDLVIEYLFDEMTLDNEGTWFGLRDRGTLALVDESLGFLKITKFSLTPEKS